MWCRSRIAETCYYLFLILLLDFVVDQTQAVKFALDIACGMGFLHTLEPMIPRHYLNSKSVMVRKVSSCNTVPPVVLHNNWMIKGKCVARKNSDTAQEGSDFLYTKEWHFTLCFMFPQIDEDMTARISMADVKFSFQCPGRMYSPAWVAPEGRHHLYSTDPKWQLKPHKLQCEWWIRETLDCSRAKCNLQLISPTDRLKSKPAGSINWL